MSGVGCSCAKGTDLGHSMQSALCVREEWHVSQPWLSKSPVRVSQASAVSHSIEREESGWVVGIGLQVDTPSDTGRAWRPVSQRTIIARRVPVGLQIV
jgi:hypothetical protein